MTEVKLLEYKPSIIVASTLLSASYQLLPLQFPNRTHEINKNEEMSCRSKCKNLKKKKRKRRKRKGKGKG